MAFTESNRESLILTLIVTGLAGVIGLFVQRRQPQAVK
jgi:hypothetical protein